jgi:hypothetical protein
MPRPRPPMKTRRSSCRPLRKLGSEHKYSLYKWILFSGPVSPRGLWGSGALGLWGSGSVRPENKSVPFSPYCVPSPQGGARGAGSGLIFQHLHLVPARLADRAPDKRVGM